MGPQQVNPQPDSNDENNSIFKQSKKYIIPNRQDVNQLNNNNNNKIINYLI
jgi:hypothetical protein